MCLWYFYRSDRSGEANQIKVSMTSDTSEDKKDLGPLVPCQVKWPFLYTPMVLLLDGSALSMSACRVKRVLPEKKIRLTTALDVNKCLERVKLHISIHAWASLNELPSNRRTIYPPVFWSHTIFVRRLRFSTGNLSDSAPATGCPIYCVQSLHTYHMKTSQNIWNIP